MHRRGLAWAAFLALAFVLIATPARAAGRAECFSLPSQILHRAVHYCALLPPSYDADKTRRYPVLYFLHGLGGNEQTFLQSGGINLVSDMWERRELGEFLLVTPDGDDSFYINSADGRVRYEDFFLREFIPFVEKRYRISPGRKFRAIGGLSMGGYGALHIAFRNPQLFGSVSAHSAALIESLPEASARNAAEIPSLRFLGKVFGSPPDRAFWQSNSPLTLAKTAPLKGLPIYFDCGSEDDYGFYAGAKALDAELTARHIAHEFHIYPGGHNWDYFAEHLPASLEFHSKAFGLPVSTP